MCDSLPVVHNQLQRLNTSLEKVNDHNVPVKAGTLCLSASAAAAPLFISLVSRGSSVKSGEEVPQGHRWGRKRSTAGEGGEKELGMTCNGVSHETAGTEGRYCPHSL